MTLFETTIEQVGPDAADLLEGGVLILFAAGAPPELAEVSVTHVATVPAGTAPEPGDRLRIASEEFRITAIGASAWQKVTDIGHVVFSFSGAAAAERPGEICVEEVPAERLAPLLQPGATLGIVR